MRRHIGIKHLRLCVILLLPCLMLSALAQDAVANETRIDFGGIIEGHLDNGNPREVFYIDGLRGEVIQFELRASGGSLDPVLSVFDSSGAMQFYRDDTDGERHIRQNLALERTGRYFVVVGRFGHSLGSTSGDFELRMMRVGVLSKQGSALRYGDAVIDTISDARPQVYYAFQAEQGDIVRLSMVRSSGTLDPYLQVVNGERYVIADNDDQPGAETRNARIDALIIEQTDTYIIVATRYGGVAGDSVGSFALRLEEAENSGTGSLALAPLPIRYGETKAAALSHQQYERFYTFHAQQNDRIAISMSRSAPGQLDSYIILADADYAPLVEDDDGGEGQNSLITSYRIPASGKYHIIATRYEGRQGTTIGHYQLSLESFGDVFETAAADALSISYGTGVKGRIDADDVEELYVFHARQDDIVTVSMTRSDGNLDPVVDLLNSAQELIMSDDDSGNGQDSLISAFSIPDTGLYYIRARRYDGSNGNPDTAGAYVLTLAQRFD